MNLNHKIHEENDIVSDSLKSAIFLITKKQPEKKKKDTLNTNGKDEDGDNFRIYHSKQHELEGGTARSFKYRKVKNKQTNF